MRLLFLFLGLFAAEGLVVKSRRVSTSNSGRVYAYKNEQEREEQFRLQQEMLARRKDPKAKAKAQAELDARRIEVTKQATSSMWAMKVKNDKEDPLELWQKNKAEGKLKDLGYEETAKNRDLRFSIPLIASPIDQPAYDNGLRFDLRLPYAERGYEDESADVMGNMGKAFKSLFGGKKSADKEGEAKQPPPPPPPKKKGLW